MTKQPFNPAKWTDLSLEFNFEDITYHISKTQDVLRVAFNRPECRNAFRPQTVDELLIALNHARAQTRVGCVLITGNGPSPKDGGWAFSSGGDQRIRGAQGYDYSAKGDENKAKGDESNAQAQRLHILDVQRLIRVLPKVVIAVVPGWAVGVIRCMWFVI